MLRVSNKTFQKQAVLDSRSRDVRGLLQNSDRSLRLHSRDPLKAILFLGCLYASLGLSPSVKAAPGGLAAQVTGHSVILTCTPSTTVGVSGYNFYKSTDGTTFTKTVSNSATCATVDTVVVSGSTYWYYSTAISPSGESIPSNTVSAVIPGGITPPPPTCTGSSFFGSGINPTLTTGNDPAPVTMGLKLSAKVAWTINCVRFYRVSNSTGPLTYAIYNATTKAVLASGSFTSISPGWNVQPLSTPLSVAANVSVVVAVNSVRYSYTYNYFTTAKNDPTNTLTAPINAGTFIYGATIAFPTSISQATNYWVDVVFTAIAPPLNMTTVCSFSSPIVWTCNSTLQNVPVGQTIQSVTTTGTITNTTNGTVPASLKGKVIPRPSTKKSTK